MEGEQSISISELDQSLDVEEGVIKVDGPVAEVKVDIPVVPIVVPKDVNTEDEENRDFRVIEVRDPDEEDTKAEVEEILVVDNIEGDIANLGSHPLLPPYGSGLGLGVDPKPADDEAHSEDAGHSGEDEPESNVSESEDTDEEEEGTRVVLGKAKEIPERGAHPACSGTGILGSHFVLPCLLSVAIDGGEIWKATSMVGNSVKQ
ncbi:hypothetical protein U1Q18_009795, partial [Sarracenia purpurea var. burkii]